MITWSDEYEIGYARLDEQHRHLVRLLGALYAEVSSGTEGDGLWRMFGELEAYAADHFAIEEGLMKQHGLSGPLTDYHLAAHQDFRHRVSEFKARHTRGERRVAIQLLAFLHGWLVDHILTVDKASMQDLSASGGVAIGGARSKTLPAG